MDSWRNKGHYKGWHKFSFEATYLGLWQRWGWSGMETLEERQDTESLGRELRESSHQDLVLSQPPQAATIQLRQTTPLPGGVWPWPTVLKPDCWVQSDQINNWRRQPVTADHWKYRTGCLRSDKANIWHYQRQIQKGKNSGKYKRLLRWKPLWSPSWFAIFSFLHSFITFISCPPRLCILTH